MPRRLVKAKIFYDGNSEYAFSLDNRKSLSYKGSKEGFTKFLRKIQAKDSESNPKSNRKYTYGQISDKIISRENNEIWLWDNVLNNLSSFKFTDEDMGMKESIKEIKSMFKEVSSVVKSLAKKANKPVSEVEDLWDEAVKITIETFGKPESDFGNKEYSYVTGVLKNMLGLKERENKINVNEFLKEDIDARSFLESVVSTSYGTKNPIKKKTDEANDDDYKHMAQMDSDEVDFINTDDDYEENFDIVDPGLVDDDPKSKYFGNEKKDDEKEMEENFDIVDPGLVTDENKDKYFEDKYSIDIPLKEQNTIDKIDEMVLDSLIENPKQSLEQVASSIANAIGMEKEEAMDMVEPVYEMTMAQINPK